jgi:hypothetical protein
MFYPTISVGSYDPVSFIIFTTTDDYRSACGLCQFSNSFGCYNNANPFNTAFAVGISVSCSASKRVLRVADKTEEISEDSGNTTAIDASDLVCRNSRKPDTATVNGQDYNITDENRKEIMSDLLSLDATEFATKWQAVHLGPNTRVSTTPVEARAKNGSS